MKALCHFPTDRKQAKQQIASLQKEFLREENDGRDRRRKAKASGGYSGVW